jgi:fused signal recognition particle receptor
MQELEKIKRVITKQNENAPHEVMLVLDGGAGQSVYQYFWLVLIDRHQR